MPLSRKNSAVLPVATPAIADTAFRDLVEQLPGMIVTVVDPSLRITYIGGPALEGGGYEASDIVGSRISEVTGDGLESRRLEALYERALAGESCTADHASPLNGRHYWLQIVPFADPAGTGAALSVAQDITERREHELRMARELRQLAEAQALAHIGSWEWDLDRGEVEWSAEQCRIHGVEPFTGPRPVLDTLSVIHPGDRERMRQGILRFKPEWGRFSTEYRILRAGEEALIEMHGTVQPSDDGRRYRVTGTCRDITENRRAERARREAEGRFTQAFEEAPIGMALGSIDGRFMRVNKAFSDLLGYSPEQLETTRFAAITHPDDVGLDAAGLGELVAGRSDSFRIEKRYISSAGLPIPVDLSITLVRTDDGTPSHFVIQVLDMSERKRFEGQLQYLADHDSLTGLFNRRRFEAELARELATAERYGGGGALLALDVDNFKYINDSLGHSVGDGLITQISEVLRNRLRATDVVARLGGDEFAVALPKVDRAAAEHVAAGLLEAIRSETEVQGGRSVTASLGIAMFGEGGCLTPEELMVEADIAMYDAKEEGRDRFSFYDAEEGRQQRMQARLTWADRIRVALESDGFVLHAQPLLALNGDEAPRYELLIRMLGEDGDLIPPGTFLYVAERFDLIQDIDRWVLNRAIELLAERQAAGEDARLSVNLSAKSITDPELPDILTRRFAESGADPRGLVIEVTETAAIVNVERAKSFASRLTALGCEFALDDFGAGFASFYYLKHLAFDVLKIDGEFIQDLENSRTNQLVVKALVDIARGLGKRTVAEFVADARTLELVRAYGVDYAQGFHVARPGPIEQAMGPIAQPRRSHISIAPSIR